MFRGPKVIDPKTPSSKMSEENQNIQVFVRCRPSKASEKKANIEIITEKRAIKVPQQNKLYSFDNVFDVKAKQYQVYQSVVQPLVEEVIEGYNCTVFAYGQTGTGKTYTMIGDRSDKDVSWEDDPISGIIPRAVDQLLDELKSQVSDYTIRVSFLELYNEDAYDLLSPVSDASKLRIYNDTERKGSVIISGLVEMAVSTKAEIYEILEKGSMKRQTAPTLMNACSSRSHSIFSITVLIKEMTHDGEEVVKMGKLNLVDLAGSENIGRSGAIEERAREASNINKSLLTLGRVITSLVEKSSHIPYRDSKLTRLLQDSLGGKTKTSIIATISPGFEDLEDTISTLDYAQRAKKITNKPEINLKLSKKTLLNEYLHEINRLQRDLEAARDKKGVFVDAKNFAMMEVKIKDQEQSLEVKEARIEFLQGEVDKITQLFAVTKDELDEKLEELENTKQTLDKVSTKLVSVEEDLKVKEQEVVEKEVLLDAHQKAEQNLLNQATEVKQVADKCVDDNNKLYSKIDSYQVIESYNSEFITEFKEKYQSQITEVGNFSSYLFNTVENGYQSFVNILKTNETKILSNMNDIETNSAKMDGRIETFLSTLLELSNGNDLKTITTNLRQVTEQFKNEMTGDIQKNNDCLKENKAQFDCLIESLMEQTVKNRSNVEEEIMTLVSDAKEDAKKTILAVYSIQDEVLECYKQKCIEIENLKSQIVKLKTNLHELNEDIQPFITKLNQYKAKVDDIECSVQDNFVTVTDKIVEIDSELNNHLKFKVQEFEKAKKNDETQTVSKWLQLDQCSNEDCQNVIDKCQAMKKANNQLYTSNGQFNENMLANINKVAISFNDNVDNVEQYLMNVAEKQKEEATTLRTDLATMFDSNKKLNVLVTDSLKQSNEDILFNYKTIKDDCLAMKTSQAFQIKECTKLVKELHEHGFRTYQSTGHTPRKITYDYPKMFATTSPHERILKRYKESIQANGFSVHWKLDQRGEDE